MEQDELSSENLIDKIISFIKTERGIYGDFATNELDQSGLASEETFSSTSEQAQTSPQTAKDSKSITDTSQEQEDDQSEKNSQDMHEQIEQCNSLKNLEQLCWQADVLRTDLEDTQLVFGVGNPNADLMLIGEAPGAEEDKQGKPFVGRAGQLLNKILSAINFEREDVYITNILKHRPPNNRNPKSEERQRSLPFLLKQIDLINPKLILSLGKVSAQTLLKKNSTLGSMRGDFHPFGQKYELMATYHPAALLRHAKWKRPTWEDMQMLRKRYDELDGKP